MSFHAELFGIRLGSHPDAWPVVRLAARGAAALPVSSVGRLRLGSGAVRGRFIRAPPAWPGIVFQLFAFLRAGASPRADAASLFHPPLIALRKKIGMGTITLPKPLRASSSSVGVRQEPDKAWRDWLTHSIGYWYSTGRLQEHYENFLRTRDIDPKIVPPIMRELM